MTATSAPQLPQTGNFHHQNCYSNYYGVGVPPPPPTAAPSMNVAQTNPYFNSVGVAPPAPAPPPHTPFLVYPQLYSTVNQNQIHLHLHHTDPHKAVEQYAEDVVTMVGNANLNIGDRITRGIEISGVTSVSDAIVVQEQNDIAISDGGYNDGAVTERQNHNDSSVWRPYWLWLPIAAGNAVDFGAEAETPATGRINLINNRKGLGSAMVGWFLPGHQQGRCFAPIATDVTNTDRLPRYLHYIVFIVLRFRHGCPSKCFSSATTPTPRTYCYTSCLPKPQYTLVDKTRDCL